MPPKNGRIIHFSQCTKLFTSLSVTLEVDFIHEWIFILNSKEWLICSKLFLYVWWPKMPAKWPNFTIFGKICQPVLDGDPGGLSMNSEVRQNQCWTGTLGSINELRSTAESSCKNQQKINARIDVWCWLQHYILVESNHGRYEYPRQLLKYQGSCTGCHLRWDRRKRLGSDVAHAWTG